MEEKLPKVITIIPNYNGREDTIACLQSLQKINYDHHNIIVVDNGSKDGSTEHIKNEFPDVILISLLKNHGFAGGCNIGIKRALEEGADYVYVLNNDTRVDAYCIHTLINFMKKNPQVGIASASLFRDDEPDSQWLGGPPKYFSQIIEAILKRKSDIIDLSCPQKCYVMTIVSGAAMMLNSKMIHHIGIFDERFFLNYEDTDLCLRAWQHGFEVCMVSDAKVLHKVHASFLQNKIMHLHHYYMCRNAMLLFKKHGNLRQWLWFCVAYFLTYFTPQIKKWSQGVRLSDVLLTERFTLRATWDFFLKKFGEYQGK